MHTDCSSPRRAHGLSSNSLSDIFRWLVVSEHQHWTVLADVLSESKKISHSQNLLDTHQCLMQLPHANKSETSSDQNNSTVSANVTACQLLSVGRGCAVLAWLSHAPPHHTTRECRDSAVWQAWIYDTGDQKFGAWKMWDRGDTCSPAVGPSQPQCGSPSCDVNNDFTDDRCKKC